MLKFHGFYKISKIFLLFIIIKLFGHHIQFLIANLPLENKLSKDILDTYHRVGTLSDSHLPLLPPRRHPLFRHHPLVEFWVLFDAFFDGQLNCLLMAKHALLLVVFGGFGDRTGLCFLAFHFSFFLDGISSILLRKHQGLLQLDIVKTFEQGVVFAIVRAGCCFLSIVLLKVPCLTI